MEDYDSRDPVVCGEHLIAAAFHIVKALDASKNLNPDMRRILTELGIHLSAMTVHNESEAERTAEVENRLKFVEKNIMGLQSKHLKIHDSGSHDVSVYIQAVDEVRQLAEVLESMPLKKAKGKQLLDIAHNILQMAMVKLQKELVHILANSMQQLDHMFILPNSCAVIVVDEESINSAEDDLLEGVSWRETNGSKYEHYLVNLVDPNAIPLIKSIAEAMFGSHYEQEFCQAFISFWKNALNDYMITLKIKSISIEDVLKMEWKCLNCRIKKWCRATITLVV